MMPLAMIAATASLAISTSSNDAISTFAASGLGSSLTVTSTMTPSRPSEPCMSASRS